MIFLKLGGSLITDKAAPLTPRGDVIERLALEIADAYQSNPDLRLLLGHGSGSFGHFVADEYQTQHGVETSKDWHGFTEVWNVANRLNRIVIDALRAVGLSAMSFPPSASALCEGRAIVEMAVEPIRQAIDGGLLPVVQGDVAIDRVQGGTIISTEEVFQYLSRHLHPSRVLLAGIEDGVYQDYPAREKLIPFITEDNIHEFTISTSAETDVTGGMAAKVRQALSLCREWTELEVRIFSGKEPGAIKAALGGAPVGTLISSASRKDGM